MKNSNGPAEITHTGPEWRYQMLYSAPDVFTRRVYVSIYRHRGGQETPYEEDQICLIQMTPDQRDQFSGWFAPKPGCHTPDLCPRAEADTCGCIARCEDGVK